MPPTFDEPLYITCGLHYWETGTYVLNSEHPPLVKDIAAVPLLFQSVTMPKAEPSNSAAMNEYGRGVFYRARQRPEPAVAKGKAADDAPSPC